MANNRKALLVLAGLLLIAGLRTVQAQALVDTLVTWRTYASESTCRVRIYPAPSREKRSRTVIIDELATNLGPSTLQEAGHLADLIGRRYTIPPEAATWVFHWGAFSYPDASGNKEVFLRATFRESAGGTPGSPSWRVIDREEVETLTDRHYR